MTRSREHASISLVCSSALTTALVLGVFDAFVARFQRQPAPWTRGMQLEALRQAVVALLAAYIVIWIVVRVFSRRFAPPGVAVSRALALGLFAALLDIEFVRWDAIQENLWAVSESLVRGAVVGMIAYPFLARWSRAGDGPGKTPGRLGATMGLLLSASLFFLVLAAPSLASGDGAARAARPVTSGHEVPRVIFIVADTLRADALSHASETAPPTPVIDALASRSVRFERARTPAPWTLPAVASTMTGLSPLVHGATTRDSSLPREVPTLAERMAEAGYRTAAIGHNFVLSAARRIDRGFDEYDFGARANVPARSLGFLMMAAARRHQTTDVEAADINERAFAWLAEHAEEDFFLWLHYYDPHIVYEPPTELRPEGEPPAGQGFRFGHEGIGRVRSGFEVPSDEERRWVRALYDAEVRYLDRELGALFEELDRLGLLDDTLIVFTSDHGEEFWEHEGIEHGHTMYEELLEVPLLVKLPGRHEGVSVDRRVTLEQLVPSVLTLCGLDYDPAQLSAPSLFSADGRLADPAEVSFVGTGTLYHQDRLAVIFSGWKYVRFLQTGVEELYHLEEDPGELSSLVPLAPPELAEGRRRADGVVAAAEELRARLGIRADERADLSDEERARLRDIGYAAQE